MKTLEVTHLFEINNYGHCIAIGECRMIGNYFRAVRKSFTTGCEYIGPWVNWSSHTDLVYVFTALPVGECFIFTEEETESYVTFNDGNRY